MNTASLVINGFLQIPAGAQSNYVLKSDTSGNASWGSTASLVGPQGTQGYQGVGTQGFQGSIGNQGVAGTNGSNGSQGPQGNQGTQGSQSYQGNQGSGLTVGSAVPGGTDNEVLYVDGNGNLAGSTGLAFDGVQLVVSGLGLPGGFNSSGTVNPGFHFYSNGLARYYGNSLGIGLDNAFNLNFCISSQSAIFTTNSNTTPVTITQNGLSTNSLQVTSGATSGYVLTSDTSGNATWQAPSVGSVGPQGATGPQGSQGPQGSSGSGGSPGGSSGMLQYNYAGAFSGASNITTDGTSLSFSGGTVLGNGSISTSGSSIVIGQTGDSFGSSSLTLENRNGAGGAVFSTVGADYALVDFGFTATAGLQANLRFENRSGSIDYSGNATHGAFQIIMNSTGGGASSQPFEIGEYAAIFYSPSVEYLTSFPGKIGVRTNDPLAIVHICTDYSTPCGIDQAASGQTADIRQFQNSSGTVLSGVDCNGCFRQSITSGEPTTTPAVGTTMFDPGTYKIWIYGNSGWKSIALS